MKALYMNAEGVIVFDKDRCIGCTMCFIACPFGTIEENAKESGEYSISKCDLCASLETPPVCVNACPTKALAFEDADLYSKNKRRKYIIEMAASDEAASN
jgi:Fe-S-cluster-containing hydrogenase component 2